MVLFSLSTKSVLGQLLRPDYAPWDGSLPDRPSWRGEPKLRRFPLFTEFTVDIADHETGYVLHPEKENMAQFSTNGHMAIFGRPLWSAYDATNHRLDYIARVKLLGGNIDEKFVPQNCDHAFAVLSVRLCLDLKYSQPDYSPLGPKRSQPTHAPIRSTRCFKWDHVYQDPCGTHIGESCYAASVGVFPTNWLASLHVFTSELLECGAIGKESKGELFSRLMFTVAHDTLSRRIDPLECNAESLSFTVHDFLKVLYSRQHHKALSVIDNDVLMARMNFLGFASTESHLDREDGCLCQNISISLLHPTATINGLTTSPSTEDI